MEIIIYSAAFIIIAVIINTMEDNIMHHFSLSIFNSGSWEYPNYDSYWFPNWTRKYNPADGRRKTWFNWKTGIPIIDYFLRIPVLFFDGWHLLKVIRQWMIGNVLWLILPFSGVSAYCTYLFLFGSMIHLIQYLFYDNLLLKHKEIQNA